MFTDVYIGLVKTEKFDYDKEGDVNGYSPDFALQSMKPVNKPALAGERDLYWDILGHPKAKKTDWGCFVIKMTTKEMIDFLCQKKYKKNAFAQFLVSEMAEHLDCNGEYLLVAMES